MKSIYKFLPLIFIILVWGIFASPYFTKGLVPYPSTYQVNHFPPWNSEQKYWGIVKNGAMPDIIGQIYPWRHLAISDWKNGIIPLWNPNNFAGTPLIANFQSAAFSITNIFFFLLPFIDAWSLGVLIQPILAGIGMYLFVRSLGSTQIGAVIGSVSFMFCGFITVWMAYGTLALAASMLPFILYGMNEFSKSRRSIFLLIPLLAIPVSIFAGHFQTSLYVLIYSFCFSAFLLFRERSRILFVLFLIVLLGVLIAGVQLLPTMQFYQYSVRSGIYNQSGGIDWRYLPTIFAPNFYGNPVTRNDWFGQYAEWASFIGIIPLTLALIAIFVKRSSEKSFFIFFGVATFLFSIDSPLQLLLGTSHLPVLSTSYPSRIIILCSFSLCVLAAYGWESVSTALTQRKLKQLLPGLLMMTLLLVVSWLAAEFSPFITPDRKHIAERNLIIPSGLFFVLLSALFSLRVKPMKHATAVLGILLIGFVTIDTLLYVTKWIPFDPKAYVFPSDPVITAMQTNLNHGRVYGNLGGQVESYYNIPSLEGYDPLFSRRYGEFIQSANTGQFTPAQRSVVSLSRRGMYTDRVLDLLGVTEIFEPIADIYQSWAYPAWEKPYKYAVLYRSHDFLLLHNKTALNRPSLFYDYTVSDNDQNVIKTFYSPDFPYRKKLILAADPGVRLDNTGSGSAQIVSENAETIVIRARSNTDALLFLPDTNYPGWTVQVNNKVMPILQADYAFRAVVLPSGNSEVIFRYKGVI